MPRLVPTRAVRLAALTLALGAAAGVRAQVPDALRGTWADADTLAQVLVVDGASGPVDYAVLYEETSFTGAELTWTTISRVEGTLMGWRETRSVRAEGDRLILSDSLDTRYRLAGDTLTVTYEQPDGGTVVTVLRRVEPSAASGLVGLWDAGWVDDGAGILVSVELQFLADGTARTSPQGAHARRYALAGPFLLLWDKIPPQRAARGEVPSYEVYRVTRSGDRLTLSSPSQTLRLRRAAG